MAKILLVEDDNNLREIYEARLQAEGYDIVSARDGEEALTVAMKERPDLIISDVMMPKISGFDMLDIIRSTEETKNAKVIMMTALSQAEDKTRAEKLGADRYLVKSQVTLEDVAKVAREVLSGESPPPKAVLATPDSSSSTSIPPVPTAVAVSEPASASDEPTTAPTPLVTPPVVPEPLAAVQVATSTPPAAPVQSVSSVPVATVTPPSNTGDSGDDDEQSAIAKQIESFIDSKKPEPTSDNLETPSAPEIATVVPTPAVPTPVVPSNIMAPPIPAAVVPDETSKKVIEPIVDSTPQPNLNDLLKKEEEKDQMANVAKQLVDSQTPLPPNPFADPAAQNPEPAPVPSAEQLAPVHSESTAPVEQTTVAPSAPTQAPTTGTNMDGVIQPPGTQTPQKPTSGEDPNNISL